MSHRHFVSQAATGLALGALVLVMVGAPAAARAASHQVSADPAFAPLVAMHQADMRLVPASPFAAARNYPRTMPFLVGTDARTWYARKAAARYNRLAPYNPLQLPGNFDLLPDTPVATIKFAGQVNSASTCPYFGGCQPPDQAIAASSNWEVQGVNTSFAVYNHAGTLQSGWPKNAQNFFGVANPGSCDPNGPFLSDPRAFYDPADGRFWVASLQVEGAFGINSCPEKSIYWVAVSQTGDPTGAWNIYAFDMTFGTTNAADYTQIGLDKRAFYFGGNMFNQFGSAYVYDEIFAASKANMEAGSSVTAHGLKNIKVGSTFIDTLQPVLVEGVSPKPGLFVDSFNMNSNCFSACNGINVFAMANPLTAPTLTEKTIDSMTYSVPPNADEPGCTQCIETLDTRISGTPVYSNGNIWFALGTGVNNGSGTVSGVLWGEVKPTLSGSTITGGTMVQNAALSFSGDRAASFGAVMPDKSDNMIMVFDSMSSLLNPSTYFAGRKSGNALGTLSAPRTLKKGAAPTTNSRWGDYEATSYEGATTNHIWIASQFSGSNGDWATEIGSTHF